MDPEIATIQWEMLSNAEFSVAIPLYSALLTEVSPYFSDQDVSFDHCEEEDVVNNEEPENSINYVLMDITPFGYDNDLEFCHVLAKEVGVGAVPGSSFFREPVNHLIRFHFAKKDETLNEALNRLEAIHKKIPKRK